MKTYLLKCLYNIKTIAGKVKTKRATITFKIDATPEQIHASPKLHVSLGKLFQKKNINRVVAVEIKEIIELENAKSE